MSNLESVLQEHVRRYPQMQAQDALKLLYQRAFGCGHMVTDFEDCLSRLRDEYLSCTSGGALFEPLGNGYSRLYLGNAREESISPWLIARLFYLTAGKETGTREGFLRAAENCRTYFDAHEIDALIKAAISNNYVPFSHSQTYRDAYHPAYRVVLSEYERLMPLMKRIENMRQNGRVTVAIDGRCGAGKTTLAARLAEIFDCPVVHMDDFFLPPAMRTPERLATVGGNVDIERFIAEVAPQVTREDTFSYGIYDCGEQRISAQKAIPASDVLLVEGSYSHHPQTNALYAIKVFCDIDRATQIKRLAARNPDRLNAFVDRWIPMEERYFSAFRVKESSDFVL